jgi:four helix bundle protein
MPFKFEKLRVWTQALDYIDLIYELANQLPRSEEYNLKSQITRAATSVALNIAEGSISQSNAEQARFLSMAIRSLVETVACQHIMNRRQLLPDQELLRRAYKDAEVLVASLHTLRKTLLAEGNQLREAKEDYALDSEQDS